LKGATVARVIERAAGAAGLDLKAHPHMLRHAFGYAPRQQGHDTTLGRSEAGHSHRSITSTAVYAALAPNRFKDFCGTEVAAAINIGRASVYRGPWGRGLAPPLSATSPKTHRGAATWRRPSM
jgi:hypothetical protein